jgi:hypothetical protein
MKIIITYLILPSLLLISCQKIFFNESESTREILLKDFHAVKIYGIYNISLVQDSANSLVIKGKNDIGSIDAVVLNDTLIINNHKKMSLNTSRNTIALHFSNLRFMVTYDPVNVSNEDTIKAEQFLFDGLGEIAEVSLTVDCNSLVVSSSANTLGNFHFKGKSKYCMFFSRYGCSIFADSLVNENSEIINESIGDIYINSSGHIKAYIWGNGNIYYHGNPVIELAEKRGNGRMIRLY